MIFPLVLLYVAAFIQVSPAGMIRHNELNKNDVEVFIEKIKEVMGHVDTITKAVLKNMSTTAEYSEYKQDLENYLTKYDEKKDKFDGCFPNLFEIILDFDKMYSQFVEDETPAAAKEVRQLFYSHGMKEVEVDGEEFMKTMSKEKMQKDIYSWTPEYRHSMFNKCNSPIVNA